MGDVIGIDGTGNEVQTSKSPAERGLLHAVVGGLLSGPMNRALVGWLVGRLVGWIGRVPRYAANKEVVANSTDDAMQ